jgi:hypothetical protein
LRQNDHERIHRSSQRHFVSQTSGKKVQPSNRTFFLNVTAPGLIDGKGTFRILITAVKHLEIIHISSCKRLKGNCTFHFSQRNAVVNGFAGVPRL